MLTSKNRRVPGTDILERSDVEQLRRHEEDVVFLVDPDTDEYTQVRPDRTYDLKPGTEVDVSPRTDRGEGQEGP